MPWLFFLRSCQALGLCFIRQRGAVSLARRSQSHYPTWTKFTSFHWALFHKHFQPLHFPWGHQLWVKSLIFLLSRPKFSQMKIWPQVLTLSFPRVWEFIGSGRWEWELPSHGPYLLLIMTLMQEPQLVFPFFLLSVSYIFELCFSCCIKSPNSSEKII